MVTSQTESASARASAFITSLLEEYQKTETFRLPVMHELARSAGVSVGTMSKTVAAFCRTGVLKAAHRRGIILLPLSDTPRSHEQHPPSDPADLRPCTRVTEQLAADISKGTHPPGSRLPTYKELSLTHHTSGRVLRTAMLALVNRGVLIRDGRGFRVTAGPHVRGRGTIALIMRGHDTGEMLFTTSRMQEQLSALERECSKANADLRVIVCNFDGTPFTGSGVKKAGLRAAVMSDALLGCIVWSLTFTRTRLGAILTELAGLKKPIAILDESGTSEVNVRSGDRDRTGIFGMSFTTMSGVQIGRHLCSLGHCKTAYFSPYHSSVWSINRLAGLNHAYASAAIQGAVHPFTTSIPSGAGLMVDHRMINAHNARFLPPEAAQELLLPAFQQEGDQPFATAVADFHDRHRIRKSLEPLFRSAIRDSSITAWIAANDIVGVECLRFLRSQGRTVPDEISVVSFDDSPLATRHRLTSYNFNCPAVMHAMVAFLLDKRIQWRYRGNTKPVEIGGFVTVRESAGRKSG